MTVYFTKKESEYYTARDIYDKNGKLLLSKDQKISVKTKHRLETLIKNDLAKPDESSQTEEAISKDAPAKHPHLTAINEGFSQRMSLHDKRILEKPNDILINIIFESKTKPWWIYVNALSKYVDWLYTHSIDVAIISLMIAVKLGYNDRELTNLGIGTLLHDVGKLLIPKSIIQKRGKLTDQEMMLMKQHCDLGMSSLENYDIPKEYTDIVMQHHERLDGSGYPNGIKGKDIHQNARIVMIADTIDSITSYRPYREARTIDIAIEVLKNEKDSYSQELVSLFSEIIK